MRRLASREQGGPILALLCVYVEASNAEFKRCVEAASVSMALHCDRSLLDRGRNAVLVAHARRCAAADAASAGPGGADAEAYMASFVSAETRALRAAITSVVTPGARGTAAGNEGDGRPRGAAEAVGWWRALEEAAPARPEIRDLPLGCKVSDQKTRVFSIKAARC